MPKSEVLTSQLSYIFKIFDRGQKGKLDNSDICAIFSNLLGVIPTNDELTFIISHLRSIANSNIHDLNLSTFISAINTELSSKPLSSLLRGVFYGLSGGKDVITTNELLDMAKKAYINISPEAEYRLLAIFPNGTATFDTFVEAIGQSI
ncbi:hypothetical protein BMR1_02g02685 [Babesia microti strain RI]|uniref:EF-hand domain-containing protein n=1 Tax=Babesia microti (strain RI) TaxID=1133968 RepID=I7J6D6_BABMR|nr:hypothetical protein BMR1_02g02685 [Babesia microti strain RI]CCF73692.1 hypothetical protein BMR1_02g02685 [Babesia microti strain RI]|eukprot:XP_012648301.1 hypothetical protein BMR1_02g02685 [Babesia microti strain RI]